MAQETIKNLKARIKKAEAIRESFRPLYESAYKMAMPQRNLFTMTTQGDSKMSGLYTSVGMSALNNFVNNMQNSLTPAFTRWAELASGDMVGEEEELELNEQLTKLTDQVFTYINASNFTTASAEMYYDLAVGTGALLINPSILKDKPLNFIAVPTAQLAIEEGIFGGVGAVFRKHKLAARLIEYTWPDAKIPDKLKRIIKDKSNEEITLEEVCYHDMAADLWRYEILWFDSDREEERIYERATTYNPWIIVRWSKIAGETLGRGPLLQALPDLKMLNNGKEMAAMSMQMNAFGSYTVEEDGIINTETAQINPGGLIVVKNNPGGVAAPSIAALPRIGDQNIQEFFFEDLEAAIKRIMMDNKLPPETGSVRSPTEIIQRIKEFQADFGSAYGRLMFEYITPLFKTVIAILDEGGYIDVPVVEVINSAGQVEKRKITDELAFTKIKMLAPVAKQQALEDVQNVVQALQIVGGVDPRLTLIGYKVEELPKFFAEKLGMPMEFVRSLAEQPQAMAALAQLLQGGVQV